MWTPRRVLLFIASLVVAAGAYIAYMRFYGGVDGLPVLPAQFLEVGEETLPPQPADGTSPTVLRLIDAFGPNSPEVQDRVAYKFRLELRERGLAMACGQPIFKQEPSRFVTVSPFSIAFFAKPKPAHQMAPGEVPEISTFHAEKAVLEFDKEVSNAQDLNDKSSKLVGMELLSLPDMPSVDERRGFIEMTNNQRTADASQHLVFRTTGPLFYSAPKPAGATKPTDPDAPHIWTSAAVVVVDRKNLARPLRNRDWNTATVSGDDLRNADAIANILLGNTLPPPTITAIGMKIYLQQEQKPNPGDKRNNTGFSGVRLIELGEKVQFNLWTDGGAGFPGANNTPPDQQQPLKSFDPPEALTAVLGGLSDAASVARRFEDRNLMVIETPGSFRHDFTKNNATFEAASGVVQGVPNHVTVARLSARGRQDNLFCRTLVVDFADNKDSKQSTTTSTGEGLKIKGLTATGPHVYVGIESEQLEAQGTELRYTNDVANRTTTTILRGTPVISVREKNKLMGGGAGVLGEISLVSTTPAPNSKDVKKTVISVNSPGKLELFDEATNANTLQATWGKSLTQAKDRIGDTEQDVLTFDGGASFQDLQGGMKLNGETLKLWLSGMTPEPGKPAPKTDKKQQPLPQRMLAIGNVKGASGEIEIEQTDQLTVWFRDVAPPIIEKPKVEELAVNPKPDPMPKPDPLIPPPPAIEPMPKEPLAKVDQPKEVAKAEPEKPKPPIKMQARIIESWVVRYPLEVPADSKAPPQPPDAPKKPAKTALKYEMERTRCDDRVVVHQDPVDPVKNPRGLDIAGVKLNIDQSKAGSLMTVYGTSQVVAQVHFESLSLFGPIVIIDQPNNSANVPGYGKLIMPTSQDEPANNPPAKIDGKAQASSKVSEMEITWTKSMNFQGAKAFAEFIGNVRVTQKPVKQEAPPNIPGVVPVGFQQPDKKAVELEPLQMTRVVCHRLDTTFDRPIYFNQLRNDKPKKKDEAKKKDGETESETAKLKTAVCTPISDAEAAQLPRDKVFKGVIYLEETINPVDGKYIKAQRIDAKMLELNNDPKGRVVIATGQGEVRILQLGSKDGIGSAPPEPPKKPAEGEAKPAAGGTEMKLTLVKFPNRMVARDLPNRYQEARFDEGAQVWSIPTDNLNLQFYEHQVPKRTVYLSCADRLTVSSSPAAKPEMPAEQWMEALGNGEFENDEYRGTSGKIVYDGAKVIFEGTPDRLAKFYKKRVGVNNQHHTSARRIEYYKDGNVKYLETSSGIFGNNP